MAIPQREVRHTGAYNCSRRPLGDVTRVCLLCQRRASQSEASTGAPSRIIAEDRPHYANPAWLFGNQTAGGKNVIVCRAAFRELMPDAENEKSPDHRHYRAGWKLPGRSAVAERL